MIQWIPNDETVKPGLYVVARPNLMGFHLEVAEKVGGEDKFVNNQWKDGIPFVSLVAELEDPGTDRERRDATKAKKLMHPEQVYPILRDAFIAKAKEYGVDITSNHCDEFLNDLYDQCYHCLSKNIPDEEEDDD